MIARHWRGWTTVANANSYENLLREKFLPELKSRPGYRGGYVLRKDAPVEVEFVVINLFESLADVQALTGPNYSIPIFHPEARQLLAKIEPLASHFEVRVSTV